MESSSDPREGRPDTERLVKEIRKLKDRPDTERLVEAIGKLKDRPDAKRLIEEIRKLKDRPDTKRLIEEIRKLNIWRRSGYYGLSYTIPSVPRHPRGFSKPPAFTVGQRLSNSHPTFQKV